MKSLVLILALMLCAGAVMADPPSYTWDMEWNFDTGLDGWTLASGTGGWVDPATDPWGPILPDEDVSGGGSANLYAPDGTRFTFDVSSLGLQAATEPGGAGKDGFVLQADVYVPNLRPLGPFTYGYPGNFLENFGIQMNFSDSKACYLEGDIQDGGWFIKDNAWDNTSRRLSWACEQPAVSPDTLWWDQWATVIIDYGYTTAGRFSGWVYVPWDSYVGTAGWYQLGGADYEVGNKILQNISVGGGASWSQGQIDNVKFAYSTEVVPEPGSMLALGTGLVGLLGVIRRRK